jgi:protein TonB
LSISTGKKKRKEIPFAAAVVAALVFHALLGVFLKYNPLVAAAPAAPGPAPRPPMTMRFVEVPEGAKTVPSPPSSAKHVSDANRKAGPLIPVPKQPDAPKVRQYASAGNGRSAAPSASVAPGNQQALQSPEPVVKGPDLPSEIPQSEEGEIPAATAESLSKSLKDLDQFIGTGTEGSSGSGIPQPGGVPTGDPGSGVFFDTQGYDLGPWGNRVVALVKKNWIVPVAAELGLKGIVGISFQVDRRGRILNPQIVSSSGISSFDQAALAAVHSSDPLPALPEDFPRNALPAVFRFYYNIPVPD